ncbi:riboflavin kinase/FMN adenylyltransferase [Pleurocapsa sp. PCC 7327]|uniref:bifunctional riboflavin kinase/FAD synthetase n=1 Tax=Pleurocapsa sp. PCC 7327 TaxID=118163 RepID=UPI00029FEA37|nr:bifunctional riboflavin kinase/FAD synthetase [Pleurocapsa sp. PCC 7327]AFY77650.1 riboflavin kinase/FMN adenylyltransferase [Pleurocapsa sp. PCC 7327]
MWVTSSTDKVLTPSAIALGNFDGLHRGHQRVLQPILQQASAVIGCPASAQEVVRDSQCPYATVVTFNPHPQEFFTGQSKQLLTPLPEKVKLLEQLGVEQLVLLPFDRELAALSPQQFVEEILMRQLQATRISVGEDFRFGHKRAGTAEDLRAIAAKFGVEVVITSLQTCQGNESEQPTPRISSSAIRQALAEGDIARANRMLGRAYTLMGTVVKGQQLGKTIGFPTANLQLPPTKLLPRYGVYCVKVFLEGEEGETGRLPEGKNIITQSSIKGVMNIGCRPTVAGNTPTVEVHLLDWAGDLYGRTLTVSLEKFLRPEQKFPSIDALKAQIAFDCDLARKILERAT